MGILANTVDAGVFNPPDTALNQEAGYVAVALVQVRHGLGKPTVYCNLIFVFGCMNVLYAGCLIRSTDIFRFEVEPILGRLVAEQEVVAAAVVENHVHDYFQSLFMSLVDHSEKIFVGTIAAVYLEVIGDGITMV